MVLVNPFFGTAARFVARPALSWARSAISWRSGVAYAQRARAAARGAARQAAVRVGGLIGLGGGLGAAASGYKRSRSGAPVHNSGMARRFPARRRFAGRPLRRRRPGLVKRRRAPRVINDPASYRQLASTYSRAGKRARPSVIRARLVKDLVAPVRFRFANLGSLGRANGAVWLYHRPVDVGATKYELPVHLYNLSVINQGGTASDASAGTGTNQAPPVGYKLRINSASPGAMEFQVIPGLDLDGTTARSSMKITGPGDNTTAIIGRDGLLQWSRIRLCIWGKVTRPSTVKISIVRFKEPEFTPDNYVNLANGNPSTTVSQDAMEFWRTRTKPLVNGLIAGYPRPAEKNMKVLKSWRVNINPIDAAAETAGSDSRGHMKHLDIFNRWNRNIDFTTKVTADNAITYAQLTTAAHTLTASTGYAGWPRQIEKSLYLMIESVTPDTVAWDANDAASVGTQVSYDINIETQYGHIQKLN